MALNTLTIPHPYPDGAAEAWIAAHERPPAEGEDGEHVFAIDDGELAGLIGLHVKPRDHAAEIGYWVGVPYWGRGYATEAARAVLRFGFEDLGLNKIYAGYFARNEASGNVMRKLGMRHEGTLRQHHCKWGEYVDVVMYGILAGEWAGGKRN